MKRLLIYPALLPILSMISFAFALVGREWAFSIAPEGARWLDAFPFGMVFGFGVAMPAILLDLGRNLRRDCSLEEMSRQIATQWFWLTFYALCFMVIHWILMPRLALLGASPTQSAQLQTLINEILLSIAPEDSFSIVAQSIAFLWAVERVTGRKPAPSPAFLWHRWKRSWTLNPDK